MWWVPSQLLSSAGAVFFESAYFPLFLSLVALFFATIAMKLVGSFPFILWLIHLTSIMVSTRYGAGEALVCAMVQIAAAYLLYMVPGLSPLKPTVYFSVTLLFLAFAGGLSHGGLMARIADQALALQKIVERDRPADLLGGSQPSMVTRRSRSAAAPPPADPES